MLISGPPVIKSATNQYAKWGHLGMVECEVRSLPKPESITWMKDGLPLDHESFDRYRSYECLAEKIIFSFMLVEILEENFHKNLMQFLEGIHPKLCRSCSSQGVIAQKPLRSGLTPLGWDDPSHSHPIWKITLKMNLENNF